MQLAVTWLRESEARPADLRQRLGYNSEAAFSRVFKRTNGAISSEQYRAALTETRRARSREPAHRPVSSEQERERRRILHVVKPARGPGQAERLPGHVVPDVQPQAEDRIQLELQSAAEVVAEFVLPAPGQRR